MLALDIDGTLVGPDVRLSDRIRAAISEAIARGVKVSVATGRMPSSAVIFAELLGLVEPVIGHQGAVIRAMPEPLRAGSRAGRAGGGSAGGAGGAGGGGKVREGRIVPFGGRIGKLLHHDPIPADAARDAVRWCRENGLDPHVNHLERIIAEEDDPRFADYSAYLGRDAEAVTDLLDSIRRPVTKVIAVGEPGRPMALIDDARRRFEGRATATVSHPRFLEFTALGVTKGHAVAWLAHRAGIPMGRVMAMGDALNDYEMIVDAGHGAAMATGPARLRRDARYIAPPVSQDGAAQLIEALVLASPADARRASARLEEEARAQREAPGFDDEDHGQGVPVQ